MWVQHAVYSSSCMVLTPPHTRLSVWERTSWSKDWTTLCRQDLLTKTTFQASVAPSSCCCCCCFLQQHLLLLLLWAASISKIYSNSKYSDRQFCSLPYRSIFAITWCSRVTVTFTFVPGAGGHHSYHHSYHQVLQAGKQCTLHIKMSAQCWVSSVPGDQEKTETCGWTTGPESGLATDSPEGKTSQYHLS